MDPEIEKPAEQRPSYEAPILRAVELDKRSTTVLGNCTCWKEEPGL